jgi:cell division protein FtsA
MKLKGLGGGGDFITGLDVGTSSLKIVVADCRGARPVIVYAREEPSFGIRKGAVVDLGEASQAINRALSEVKKISKSALRNIYVSIGTPQAKMQTSRGIVAVSRADAEIAKDDMDRAVRASQAVNLPQNRTIVHTIVKEYMVDGVGDILDPLGLSGSRLEVQSLIIDAFAPHIKTLIRAVELSGGDISGLGYGPIIAAQAALSKRQRDLGTAIVDLGFGTTGLAVYEEDRLVGVSKFPVGAANISNDLAVGLKVPVDAAEEIKIHYGYAYSKEVPQKESVDMKKFADDAKGSISRKFIAEIVESRLEEIFDLVNNELKLMEKYGQLPGGVVLVGGGAKLPGLTDLVKQEMKLAAQIGFTLADVWDGRGGGFKEYLEDPEFVGAFGLVLWGMESEGRGGDRTPSGAGLKRFFGYFAP